MKEQLIMKFKLPNLEYLTFVHLIVREVFRKTGNKCSVTFNGSKGYLSNIEIRCEGIQPEDNNVIWVENLRTKTGALRSKMVHIFHSEETGIRVMV